MDNAGYHNVLTEESFPRSHHTKDELRAWLTRNHLPWTDDMLKPELYDLCKRYAPTPQFKIDQLAEAAGHSVLRTPQYHPELQPIETCWGIVKNYMADNCDFTMYNFRKQLPVAFSKVQPQICKSLIEKVVQQEEKYWHEDSRLYNNGNNGIDTYEDACSEV
jgi:hypothetical protein